MSPRRIVALLVGSLGVWACSDDSVLPLDGGPRPEAGSVADGARRDAWRGEGPRPDLYTGPCDPSCLDQDLSLCLKLPVENRCVECQSDSDCRHNPGALGNKCDKERNYCICDSDGECSGNQRGPHCDLANQMCVCLGDKECGPALPLCLGTDVKTCRPACKADADCGSYPHCDLATGRCLACKVEADCQKNLLNPHCQLASGRCVACLEGSQCPAGSPFCDDGSCVECAQAKDCAESPRGNACEKGRCACTGSSSCLSPAALGAACLSQLANWRCGCGGSADCLGKAVGSVCHSSYGFCGCGGDADCAIAPSTRCSFPSVHADYQQCGPPCSGDLECQQRHHQGVDAGLTRCAGGRCVACSSDSDCSRDPAHPRCQAIQGRCVSCTGAAHCGGLTPICDPPSGRCVECSETADCVAHPNGPSCTAGRCGCGNDSDCAGSPVWGRKCLSVAAEKRCACAADVDCAGKVPGPHCTVAHARCSCLQSGECPGLVCAPPYANASYRRCQPPCKSAADCAFVPGLPRCGAGGECVACFGDADCGGKTPFCNPGLGLCIDCRNAADCAGEIWARLCDPASGCAECLGDTDCTPSSLGKTCSKRACVCSTSVDCVGNVNGRLCDPGVRACSCLVDADCPAPRRCTGSFFGAKICA